jgi:hypothetical protein
LAADREQLERTIRNAPKSVRHAAFLAAVLGLLLGVRGILSSASLGTFSGKSLLYAALIFAFFGVNGISLLSKSRLAYVLIAIFAFLPLLGSFAGSVHLLALSTTGRIAVNLTETIVSVVSVLQIIVIVALLIILLSSATRSYVWSSPAGGEPTKS